MFKNEEKRYKHWWKDRKTNKQGSKGRAQRNKKAVCWSEGVIHGWMGWWSDGKNPGTSSQRTSRRAMGGSKPSPALGQSAPNSPTDLHPISMEFHLLPGVSHKHPHTPTDWIQHKNTTTLPHRQRNMLTHTYTHKNTPLPLPITIAQWQDKW